MIITIAGTGVRGLSGIKKSCIVAYYVRYFCRICTVSVWYQHESVNVVPINAYKYVCMNVNALYDIFYIFMSAVIYQNKLTLSTFIGLEVTWRRLVLDCLDLPGCLASCCEPREHSILVLTNFLGTYICG